MTVSTPPSITYSFSRKYKAQVYLQIVILFVVAIGAVWLGSSPEMIKTGRVIVCIGVALLDMLLCIYLIRILPRLKETITITDTEIIQHLISGSEILIRWDKIARFKNHYYLNRLDIISKDLEQTIRVEHQIEDYNDLIWHIQLKMDSPDRSGTRETQRKD